MVLGITGLVIAYVLIALLLLSINLYSKWSWQVKAFSIIITSLFYIVTYYSFPPIVGWATSQQLPSRFKLISTYVLQPNKQTGENGEIYLWLRGIKNMKKLSKPRAYKLEYSKVLHEKIIHAKTKLNQGIEQLGEFKEPDDKFKQVNEERHGIKSIHIEFYDVPDPLFPEKQ